MTLGVHTSWHHDGHCHDMGRACKGKSGRPREKLAAAAAGGLSSKIKASSALRRLRVGVTPLY